MFEKAKPAKAGDAKLKGLKMAASYRRVRNCSSVAGFFSFFSPAENKKMRGIVSERSKS